MIVSYLLPACGVGGGPKVILHHLNWLHGRGHDARLFILGRAPDWFPCRFPVTVCASYAEAGERMAERDGLKVATWWETAGPVIAACRERGAAAYLVQDIETSYYPSSPEWHPTILATYALPWRFILTDAPWTERQLRAMRVAAPVHVIPPPIDLDVFRPRPEIPRDPNRLLYCGRSSHLKDPELMWQAMRHLERWGAPLRLAVFGVEPEVGFPLQEAYHAHITDEEAARLYASSFAYVSTSQHEGFGVPHLEAMATGTPLVTTLADGNEHFCEDGENCLVVSRDPLDVASTIYHLWKRPALQRALGEGGRLTAAGLSDGGYGLPAIGARLEALYRSVLGD